MDASHLLSSEHAPHELDIFKFYKKCSIPLTPAPAASKLLHVVIRGGETKEDFTQLLAMDAELQHWIRLTVQRFGFDKRASELAQAIILLGIQYFNFDHAQASSLYVGRLPFLAEIERSIDYHHSPHLLKFSIPKLDALACVLRVNGALSKLYHRARSEDPDIEKMKNQRLTATEDFKFLKLDPANWSDIKSNYALKLMKSATRFMVHSCFEVRLLLRLLMRLMLLTMGGFCSSQALARTLYLETSKEGKLRRQPIEFVSIPEFGVEVDAICAKKVSHKEPCDALNKWKGSAQRDAITRTGTAGATSPSSVYCQALRGQALTLRDTQGNEISVCGFNDLSMISAERLFEAHRKRGNSK